jgi:hypothetical protein
LPLETTCDFAKARYLDIGRLRKLWGMLWIFLGASVALFLGTSVLLFLRTNWLPGAISLLGTIVNGTAMKWLITQRKVAANEEESAFAELVQHCGPPASSASSFAATADPGTAVIQSNWFQRLEAAKQSAHAARLYLASRREEVGR